MAFYRGEEGSVCFKNATGVAASDTVVGSRSWTLNITKDVLDCTAMGANHRSYVGSLIAASGSCEFLYSQAAAGSTAAGDILADINTTEDPADATFELYFGDGTKKAAFAAVVTSVDLGATLGDLQAVSVNFTVTGAVTLTA